MKKVLKSTLTLLVAIAVLCTQFPVMPLAATNQRCYTISGNGTTLYKDSGLTKKDGAIQGKTELTINKVKSKYSKVTCTLSGGKTKTGYISTDAILINTTGKTYKSKGEITAYKRPGDISYGHIATGDKVMVLGTYGNYTQVRYPANTGYKYAFIPTTKTRQYITADIPKKKAKLASESGSVVIGETTNIKIKNAPKTGISFKSNNPSIATVSKNGKVKGIKSGSTDIKITVKRGNKTTKLTYKITVKKPKLSKSELSLTSGKESKLTILNKPKNAKYTWSSSDKKIATINKSGIVTAKNKGTATITVTVKTTKKTYNLSCKVTVKSTPSNDADSTIYTARFYMNDNTETVYQTVSVVSEEIAAEPTPPTREGYTFNGWYENAKCSVPYDFDCLVLKNIDLYACWEEIGPYTIEFDSAGGTYIPAQTIEKDQLVTRPTDPEKTGYVFLGWLDDNQEYFEFDEISNRNCTLTADWVEVGDIDDSILDEILGANTPQKVEQNLDGTGAITNIGISYKLDGTGKVSVSQIKTGSMLSIPGYLDSVDINALGANVTEASIAFHYDPAQLAANAIDPQNLAIVWYDEENDIVTLLDSNVNTTDNTVSVTTSHFSKYAVVNLVEWMKAWTTSLPTIRTDETPYYSVALAMDCSGSMSGEKMSKSIEAAQNMIDVLMDNDRVTLLAFEDRTTKLLDQMQLTSISDIGEKIDNREIIKEKIAGLRASGGTDIEEVLQVSLQSKSTDPQYQSFVILLSDGQDRVSDSLLADLKANGQRVITVGIGSDVDQTMMQKIANATDGTYLYCENAGDLAAAFRAIQDAYIGSSVDTDGDGLPDLVETTGMRDQYGEIWTTDPNNPDSDGDGISDGEEMGTYHALAQYPYFQRVSRPDRYTVKSDEAYLLMPENMMYAFDSGDNKLTLEVYVTDGSYRMVPDLLTPPDDDGIPKEYVYSPPVNLKVEVSNLPDGVILENLNTINEGMIDGTLATSYKTTAVLSYTKNVTLENVTWNVTADNCSEWSGYAEDGIKATYVKKTQSVSKTKIPSRQETSRLDQARLDLAQSASDLVNKLYSKAETKAIGTVDNARNNIKKMMNVAAQCHSEDTIPDSLYDAFAQAILDAMDASKLEPYERNMNKLSNQIYKQIKGGHVEGEAVKTINKISYTVTYNADILYGLGYGHQKVSWINNGYHYAYITWENVSSKDGCKALADYCAALAQLNKGVWMDFLAYYVSDACNLIGVPVKKENIDKVFTVAEKTIKALCNKDDADDLINEMGGELKDKLKSGLFNEFKNFIKNNVPNGDKIVKAAEQYKKAKEKLDKFQEFCSSSDSEKAVTAYNEFEEAYKKLEDGINSI